MSYSYALIPYASYYSSIDCSPNLSNKNCDCDCATLPIPRPISYQVAKTFSYAEPNFESRIVNSTNAKLAAYAICCDPCFPRFDALPCVCPPVDPNLVLNLAVRCLVSNFPGTAMHCDRDLFAPWGIIVANDIIWVSNTFSGTITVYNLLGKPIQLGNIFRGCLKEPTRIRVPDPTGGVGKPTGIVFNCNKDDFKIYNGSVFNASTILIATRDGTINGYNFDVHPQNSVVIYNNSLQNCVYTGLTLCNSLLYVADFFNRKIDVFDGRMNIVSDFVFRDECLSDPLPNDFAPFNVAHIGDFLYVTYAKQNPCDPQFEIYGPGCGYVNIFSLNGIFIKRFVTRSVLNAPWGIVLAPNKFGYPAGSIIIGNVGDGLINVFDPNGIFLGNLKDGNLNCIQIDRIKGLATNCVCPKTLYWTASPNNLKDAIVGTITTRCIF